MIWLSLYNFTLKYYLNILPFVLLIFLFISTIADTVTFFLQKLLIKHTEELEEDMDEEEDSDLLNDISNGDNLAEFTALDPNVVQVISDTKVKLDDVAGSEEAKQELTEVIKFLKDPESFSKLGAGIPKGVLLGGPPGTGKTLLAKAIAGESGVPFLKVSGSQFVELLVGIGAARVRELFDKARDLQPSIIFIDEIDSIARARSGNSNMGGGANDEREQTLNQILTEMDGFDNNTGVVVMAATNRIDILDPAIKRPGRFDRQISINLPNFKERQAILKVHARGKKFKASLGISQIAQRTLGFSGADLANLLNEAAILATRLKKESISMDEINLTVDRLVVGLEGKQVNRVKARQTTGFHEMGHAFVGSLINENDGIEKLTLIPRGNSQGTTWTVPSGSQYNPRNIFIRDVLVAIGGRAAEEMINGSGECTVGAQQDLAQLTRNLRTMVIRYAMAKLQELKQQAQQRNLFFIGSDVKQELSNIIDNFTTIFMDTTYKEVLDFLDIIRPGGERLVDELMASEELTGKELRSVAREYISNLTSLEVLYNTRESSLLDTVGPEFDEYLFEIEEEIKQSLEELEKYTKRVEETTLEELVRPLEEILLEKPKKDEANLKVKRELELTLL